MKNRILITFCLFNSILVSNAQELTLETTNKNIIGYWQRIGYNSQNGFQAESNEMVLVVNSDKTISYYVNKKKLAWGTYSVDSLICLRLNTTMHKNNFLLPNPYDVIRLDGSIMQADRQKLVFGYTAVDGIDAVYERMSTKQVDNFLGKKKLSKLFRRKSEKRLLSYFEEWQQMEPTNETEMPNRAFDPYQKEAYTFFSDYYSSSWIDINVPKFAVIELSLNQVGNTNFELPSALEMDRFVNKFTGKKDCRAEFQDEKTYNTIVKDEYWGRYFEEILAETKIQYHTLDNFNPPIKGNKNSTYLLLREDRKSVIDYCMRNNDKKYRNWFFIKKYLCSGNGVQYNITARTIQNLVFNTQLNLAIVGYVYPYSWVQDLYEKKGGKWQFHSTIRHRIQ